MFLSCHQSKLRTAEELVTASQFDPTERSWMPVLDYEFNSSPFLPYKPEELLQSGQFNTEVEVVLGMTKDEGIVYLLDVLGKLTILPVFTANGGSTEDVHVHTSNISEP